MNNQLIEDYRSVFRIRNFENKILDLFSQNRLTGTTHTCLGQEATPVALMDYIQEQDSVFGSHRCHGYFIAYAKTYKPLLAEIMGKKSGMCKGRGGSQHICYKNFTTNGVQGGIVPNATGIAYAEKCKGTNGISVAILGDGTLGQGVVYESMNLASILKVPVLYIIEDNGYAMTTPSSYAIAGGDIKKRIEGFGIRVSEIESNDTCELRPFFREAVGFVRFEQKPMCCVVHTYRLGPHSKGDDFRDPEELNLHRKKDPIVLMEQKLDADTCKQIRDEEIANLDATVKELEKDEVEGLEALMDLTVVSPSSKASILNEEGIRCVSSINEGIREELTNNKLSLILGEDIRDPYGGAFKATKGLTAEFSDRVINTPISEAGMIGLGVGMAMHGLHPIIEMMFGDFLSLGFDQLLNHGGKYNWMYAGQVNVPMLVRAPMGGKRGYGATHSQSLEKFMVGIPGVDVLAISPVHNPKALLKNIFTFIDKPTILIEEKALYGQRLLVNKNGMIGSFYVKQEEKAYPMITLTMDEDDEADVAILTYGGMTEDAMEAAEKLMMENEILAKIVLFTRLSPVDYDAVVEIIGNTKAIVTVEAGTKEAGWGSEMISSLSERLENCKYARCATPDFPIPCNKPLEDAMIPGSNTIYSTIKKLL